MKRRRRIGIQYLLVIAAFFVVIFLASREPSYDGRTLTSWLKQCLDTPLDETKRLTEAQDAVRAIGANKALPILTKLAEARDGPIRSWVIKQNERRNIRFFKLHEALDKQMLAVAGFEVLGTNGAPAVPKLTGLLEDADHAFTAVRCLSEVGKAAEFALCRGLTNKNPQVRRWSIGALAAVTDDVEVYVARVTATLKDPDGAVQHTAFEAIADQTHAPDIAVPILATALSEDSAFAARLLVNFGTNALVTFGALSNAVDHGSSETARQALNTLVAIAPQEALPMVLNRLHSPEPRDRGRAVAILCDYAVTNSEILPALKLAATDTNPVASRAAKQFITDLYRAGRPDEFLFPDEPGHAGKRLGEWLKQSDRDVMFSDEAQDALRHIGTNAIPALLARLIYKRPPYDLPAREVNIKAMGAFMVLGEQAKSALPNLENLMESEDQEIALHALLAASNMGADGVRCLVRGLSNQHPDVRSEAAHFLGEGPATNFPEQRKPAIPILIKLLSDSNEFVRMNAANAIKEIEATAAARAGMK